MKRSDGFFGSMQSYTAVGADNTDHKCSLIQTNQSSGGNRICEMFPDFRFVQSEQKCSDNDHNRLYGLGMDSEVSDSLEAIANLLYLIRKSLNNPAAISAYVGLAEDRIRVIASTPGRAAPPKGKLGRLPYGPPLI
jgi:hypothetical protein